MPKAKRPKRAKLRDKLDRIFSVFIRLRDSDKHGNITCITCKKQVPRKQSHACHFVSRGCVKLRRDEENVHAGCSGCNTYNQQRHGGQYMLEIEKLYGTERRDELRSQKYKLHKRPGIADMEEMIIYYKDKVKELKEQYTTDAISQ